jgi:DNA-binding CsgD family transcriptional regulator/tetratricopeptide (TPR) repeat protein
MLTTSPDQPDRPTVPPTLFVGRDAELRELLAGLDRMLAGRGQVLLLVGEPGIGKTRTAEELAAIARERGAHVLWGQCHEWEGAPAYWPWTQVLRAWLREVDDGTLRAATGPKAALLAQLIPDIQQRVADLPALPAMEPEALRFQLLAATGALIRIAATRQPLVIVLDDIHWADTPSLQLLRFLASEIRDDQVLLVANYRDVELDRGHPATPIVADIAHEPNCRRVTLRGLPKPQVARFVALVTGQAQSPALVDAVYAETDGNPFFVTEVVRLLAEEGQLDDGAGAGFRRSHVPESVRDAVGRRLDRLSPACNRALAVAAVIGRDFDVRVLERATGVLALELLDALDEAVRAQLVIPGEAPGGFRFSHALVQETLYQAASSADRARLHLAVGQALEVNAGREPPWAELARHFYQSAPLGAPEKVATYAARAGDAAMAQLDWEAAASRYQHALAALSQLATGDAVRRCDLLLALGEAQNRSGSGAGDVPAARTSFLLAFELARELGDGERMAQAAVGNAGFNIVAAFGGPRQLELLTEALKVLDPADSPLRVRVLARLAADLWYRSPDHLEQSRALAEEAVAVAQRLGDPTLIAYSLYARHSSGYRPSNLSERQADTARLAIVAEQTGDPIAAAWGYIMQVPDCIEAGDMFGAEQAMRWLRHLDERVHIPYIAQRAAMRRAMLDMLTGRYTDAAPQVERARALWQSLAPRQHACQSFLLLRDLGRLDELTEEIELPNSLHSWRSTAQAHRMALALERGLVAAARADYDQLVANDFARVPFNQHWFSALAMLAEAAVAFDDAPRAARMFTWLEPYAERQVYDPSLGVCHGPVALYLGRLAGALGRWEEAVRRLDQALAICERLGLRPYIARTLLAQAEVLARRDGPGDHVASCGLTARAIETAEAIGMQGLIPRAMALRDALTPSPVARFDLTPRELDVLRLLAEGMTSQEIGAALFISPNTVNNHVTSILNKLGLDSRTAAAAYAVRHGLV